MWIFPLPRLCGGWLWSGIPCLQSYSLNVISIHRRPHRHFPSGEMMRTYFIIKKNRRVKVVYFIFIPIISSKIVIVCLSVHVFAYPNLLSSKGFIHYRKYHVISFKILSSISLHNLLHCFGHVTKFPNRSDFWTPMLKGSFIFFSGCCICHKD